MLKIISEVPWNFTYLVSLSITRFHNFWHIVRFFKKWKKNLHFLLDFILWYIMASKPKNQSSHTSQIIWTCYILCCLLKVCDPHYLRSLLALIVACVPFRIQILKKSIFYIATKNSRLLFILSSWSLHHTIYMNLLPFDKVKELP